MSTEVLMMVASQIVAAVAYIVATRLWVTFLMKRVDAHDISHRDHYAHAAARAIHQESMDSKLIASEFHSYKNQLNQHTSDDLRMFNEIKAVLKDMRTENQTELKDIRSAVQDVRENLNAK